MKVMRRTLLISLVMSSTIIHSMEDNKSEDSLEAIFKKVQEIALASQNPDVLQKIQEYGELKAFNDEKYARIRGWIAQCTTPDSTTQPCVEEKQKTEKKSKGKKSK